MKWDKTAIVAVVVIFSASYVYSSIKRMQLSDDVEREQLARCAEQGGRTCQLVTEHHDDCFDASYRAEFRIREFRQAEYADCLAEKNSQSVAKSGN